MGNDQAPTNELETQRGGRSAALADPPLIAAGRRLGGRYVLERRLGHGGMAVVWMATDERLERPVAVKILSDTLTEDGEYLGRFRREAQVAASLQHPNLVSVYDFDAGERPYLVMEYIDGGDLAARIRDGHVPPAERLARELLEALGHIHRAGVLHRDIKPQNVLVDHHGHARLTDFGIAQPRDATSLTRTGQVIGTEAFIAPEVRAGAPASERSDLYALGVLLADVAREGAGAPLWTLIDRLRQREPDLRPASAAEALEELQRSDRVPPPGEATRPFAIASVEEPPPDQPTATTRRPFEPTPPGARAASRRRRLSVIAAIASVALAAGIAYALLGGDDEGSGGGSGGGQGASASKEGNRDQAGGGGASGEASGASETGATPAVSPPDTSEGDGTAADGGATSEDGYTLNDEGFALVEAGSYEEAIPILERAVDALGDTGDEQTYNYALYNLGSAYVGAGRYDDAIPVLEERMNYDNQLGTVQAKLNEAYAGAEASGSDGAPQSPEEASSEESGSEKPKPEKPEHSPPGLSGGVPPGHEDD